MFAEDIFLLALFLCFLAAARWRPRRLLPHSLEARGQGLTEYALLLAFVVLVVVGILSVMGPQVKTAYEKVSCTLAGGQYHEDEGQGKSNRCKLKKKSVVRSSSAAGLVDRR